MAGMRWVKQIVARVDVAGVLLWLCVASMALRWIGGSEEVPLTIWWIVLAFASVGVICSLLGFGGIYNLVVVIIFCAAILTMKYWVWMLLPAH